MKTSDASPLAASNLVNVPLAALIVVCGVYGLVLELNPTTQPLRLYIGLHLAGLGAVMAVTCSVMKTIPSAARRCLFVLLQLLAFRIAYFPVMVLSATVACYSEWFMLAVAPEWPVRIFPAFFISVALLFAVISAVVYKAFKGNRVAAVFVAVFGVPALMISFSGLEDLTFLPDDNWTTIERVPEVTHPQRNPYLSEGRDKDINPSQKMVAVAGSVLYRAIPDAPWAQAAKGTLEQAFRNNPAGSSRDRLQDHYAAFLAAHNQISVLSKQSQRSQ